MSKKIIEILFNSPKVVNLSTTANIEVQPGVFSPVYINLKSLLAISDNRKAIVKAISKLPSNDVDYICGIESGGSYFASAVADLLNKGLILFRKNEKKYNVKNRFAGELPKKGKKILVIDDVISSGNTLAEAVNNLKEIGYKVEVAVIFSYCWEKDIEKNLNTKIYVLSTARELLEIGSSNKKLNKQNIQHIEDYIKSEEQRVYKKGGGENG